MKTNATTRRDFFKKSALSVGALSLFGIGEVAARQMTATNSGTATPEFKWKYPWQPETPARLHPLTRQLAQRGLSGEFGRQLADANWDFPAGTDTSLSIAAKHGEAALSVARNAPLRILPGELVAGSATLKESAAHQVPLLNVSSVSHTTIGFEKVLKQGYKGLRAEINERLNRGGLDADGTELLKAMLTTLDAATIWNNRNIALLESMKVTASSEEQAYYQTLIETLRYVPENEPRNFREAVQSLWSMYAFHRLTGNWSGLGRIDKMLNPYLQKDLKEKRITMDEARELIAHFWIKGTEWVGAPNTIGGTGDAQFYQNVILAGIDKNGQEVTNDVTYLILDVVEELHISDFPIAVRINARTPEKLLRRVAEVQRFGGGIVSFYSEDVVIDGLVKFGYPLDEAREFVNDGCWECIIPGKTAFTYWPFDMMAALTRTLHSDTETPVKYADFESLYEQFRTELDGEITGMQNTLDGHWLDANSPHPLVSMFVEGCIEKGKSYNNRGPVYTVNGIHAGGVADTANSLLALKKVVFEEKYVTLNDFIAILRNNWEGNEGLRQMVKNRITYYGNDDKEGDAMMCRVFDDYTAITGKVKERNGVKRPCGISTFGREIDWRMMRKASPEGSRTGDILATNCSPTPGTDKKGPTAVLNSYCKMDFTNCPNGATVELKVLPDSVKGENGVKALVSLAKVFRENRGFYLHIDVVDTA
ncbi:MAG: hypothetical protein LBS52_01540, partial [Dysgonamonadaceae bacterium]|nr:hypothetical protein [Dysgonamonadaceae bacterium]